MCRYVYTLCHDLFVIVHCIGVLLISMCFPAPWSCVQEMAGDQGDSLALLGGVMICHQSGFLLIRSGLGEKHMLVIRLHENSQRCKHGDVPQRQFRSFPGYPDHVGLAD